MKRSFRVSAFLLSFLFLSAGVAAERRGAADRLRSLFADAWEFTLDESPTFATSVGEHRNDDRLSSETLVDYERRLASRRSFIERATRIERKQLSIAQEYGNNSCQAQSLNPAQTN